MTAPTSASSRILGTRSVTRTVATGAGFVESTPGVMNPMEIRSNLTGPPVLIPVSPYPIATSHRYNWSARARGTKHRP